MRCSLVLALLLCFVGGEFSSVVGQQLRFLPREEQAASPAEVEAAFDQPWPAAEHQPLQAAPQARELPNRYRSQQEVAPATAVDYIERQPSPAPYDYRPTPGQIERGQPASLDADPHDDIAMPRYASSPREVEPRDAEFTNDPFGTNGSAYQRVASQPASPVASSTAPPYGNAPSPQDTSVVPASALEPIGEDSEHVAAHAVTADFNSLESATEPAPLELGARPARELPRLVRPGEHPEGSELPRVGGPSLLTVTGSLALVLGLFFLVAWLFKRNMPRSSQGLPTEVFEPLGRATVGGKQQVQLFRLGRKLLLVSLSPNGADTLAEITEPEEVDRLAGLCMQGSAFSTTRAFGDVLNSFSRDRTATGFVGAATESLTDLAAREPLERRYRREYGDA